MFSPDQIKPALIYGLLGCSLAINLVMMLDRDEPSATTEETAPADPTNATPAAMPPDAQPTATAAVAPPAPAPAPINGAATVGDWTVASSEVKGSVARTMSEIASEKGDALSAVYARLFVWDIDLRRELQRGDRVEVMYRIATDGNPEIAVARLHSQKQGKVLSAYRWQAPGDAFPSYWREDGVEVPYRLKNGPLQDYEQITSLLKDRPTHEGMDFKTPSGTPATSPRAGVVTRTNWNWTANGNCIEVRFDDGVLAKYLHMSENKVNPGDRVTAGQVIGLTGNTGHSTAPHLHYQLELGDKVIDPIDYHGAERRKLNAEAMAAFSQEVARLDADLGRSVANR